MRISSLTPHASTRSDIYRQHGVLCKIFAASFPRPSLIAPEKLQLTNRHMAEYSIRSASYHVKARRRYDTVSI